MSADSEKDDKDRRVFTARFSLDDYERLRYWSFFTDHSMNDIVVMGTRMALADLSHDEALVELVKETRKKFEKTLGRPRD